MKKTLQGIIVVLLVASAMLPMTSQTEYSAPLTDQGLSVLYGGKEAIDCEAIALLVEAGCYAIGGGWLACAIVTAGAYLACMAANAL